MRSITFRGSFGDVEIPFATEIWPTSGLPAGGAESKLSETPALVVGAWISRSGDAMPTPGDLQGFSKAVSNTEQQVVVVIDNEVK